MTSNQSNKISVIRDTYLLSLQDVDQLQLLLEGQNELFSLLLQHFVLSQKILFAQVHFLGSILV